ncbi:OmpA family protein [Pseudomonas sp. PDM15]|nr:OmpA family protein [Pseudomonas sp. PDM15]
MHKKTLVLLCCLSLAACANSDKKEEGGSSWWSFGDNDKPAAAAKKAPPKIDHEVTNAWLDEYEPRLKVALSGSKMELERRENVLVVTAPVDSSFNPDRPSMLMPAVLGPFTKVAKILETDKRTGVLILGHADSRGQLDANFKLSEDRAKAVASIFRLSGLQRDRLLLKGVGSDMPRAANDSNAGRALNRRVEIVLTPQKTLVALLATYNQPAPAAAMPVAQVAADQKKKDKAQ